MNIEKGNNRTVTDYHIISIGYAASTIAPTSPQNHCMLKSEDYRLRDSIKKQDHF